MSIRIALNDAPEFFTNLDVIAGRVVVALNRPEQIGAIVVKLEGESRTALSLPSNDDENAQNGFRPPAGSYPPSSNIAHENHKILYKIEQVFPPKAAAASVTPMAFLQPGQYEFPFKFKVPFNNVCSDPNSVARMGGPVGGGGIVGPGILGLGGIRVMNGSKQLLYRHVTKTLPPSFTGFPRQAEIRYFLKVTVQRPGLFKENWRYQTGFKFLPIEPPRPSMTGQEAYARRPFNFQPRTPLQDNKKRGSFFGSMQLGGSSSTSATTPQGDPSTMTDRPPSIEMSARLPHPPILTCNHPLPLRLIAKTLAPSRDQVYLISLQVDLVGLTHVRCHDLINTETTRWVVVSRANLAIPLTGSPNSSSTTNSSSSTTTAGEDEVVVPASLWSDLPLPNTVMPSFVTCNLTREYKLELKLGLARGPLPGGGRAAGKGKGPAALPAQSIFLPLTFSAVEVFSGVAPPPELVQALAASRPSRPGRKPSGAAAQQRPAQQQQHAGGSGAAAPPPVLPPRTDHEAPPPAYEAAPPSYDDAMAEMMTGPVIPAGQARPAYSGVTNENAPLTIPEKG